MISMLRRMVDGHGSSWDMDLLGIIVWIAPPLFAGFTPAYVIEARLHLTLISSTSSMTETVEHSGEDDTCQRRVYSTVDDRSL